MTKPSIDASNGRPAQGAFEHDAMQAPVLDPSAYGELLAPTVEALNAGIQERLQVLKTDPEERKRFGFLHQIEGFRGPDAEEKRAKVDPSYLEYYAFDEIVEDEGWERLLVGYAIRETFLEGLDTIAGYHPKPEDVLLMLRKYAVFKTFLYKGGAGEDKVGHRINDLLVLDPARGDLGSSNFNSSTIVRAARRSITGLDDEKASDFADQIAGTYGQMVALWEPLTDKKAGTTSTLRLLREGLVSAGTMTQDQLSTSALPPINLGQRAILSEAMSVYVPNLEWAYVEPYSLGDEAGLEVFTDTVSQMATALSEGKSIPRRDADALTIELATLVHETLRASGTDYGLKLADELENAKQPMRDVGTTLKLLPFGAIMRLANALTPSIQQSPVFAETTLQKLNESSLQELPEAFRRLMFVASHGSEGADLPEELSIDRRFLAVDDGVEVLSLALERPKARKAAKGVGAVAVNPRGQLPNPASSWRKWRRGYGYLS